MDVAKLLLIQNFAGLCRAFYALVSRTVLATLLFFVVPLADGRDSVPLSSQARTSDVWAVHTRGIAELSGLCPVLLLALWVQLAVLEVYKLSLGPLFAQSTATSTEHWHCCYKDSVCWPGAPSEVPACIHHTFGDGRPTCAQFENF